MYKFLLLAFICTPVYAEVIIYRWVDQDNVIHFSQQQPIEGYFEELTIRDYQVSQPLEVKIREAENTPLQELQAANRQKCDNAQKRLNTLTTFEKVKMVNEQGESQLLSADEKQQQIELSRAEIKLYCQSLTAEQS
jgi:hypothetical protein